jgi:hypothetical protein
MGPFFFLFKKNLKNEVHHMGAETKSEAKANCLLRNL